MLQLSATEKYYWYLPPVDMRKGFDALCGIVQSMQHNITHGGIFIFCNRKRNQIKLLHWEIDGLAIYYKRLEAGRYELPVYDASTGHCAIKHYQLQLILQGIELGSVKHKYRYNPAA
ncbi:IS66 family insertion sequence element accessory protein TnpB [Nodularia sp. LEGE 06071]|uniref:IS66 family insertion sequence element accessory protein TnpB n=1 Tax=Nodularia sp. LEGE 06071 TaxID=2777965 RepID=UPI00187E7043|nr:IS66 family insertion sequence element accessory protein TnpB [Nodularia sp. LEGE 06071]MBE9202135.1 IS66 family insertion sequence element accessory protein TnpB [Nodularia sp. LEGE 06071]